MAYKEFLINIIMKNKKGGDTLIKMEEELPY